MTIKQVIMDKVEIIEILDDLINHGGTYEVARDKLFDLLAVSNRRELLLAYEEKFYGREWVRVKEKITEGIDDFLANNCS